MKIRLSINNCKDVKDSNGLWIKTYHSNDIDTDYDYVQCVTRSYGLWRNLMRRLGPKGPTAYDGCISTFKDYQHFTEWCNSEHGYLFKDENRHWCLDKDLMGIGNRFYSPEMCCFIPTTLNSFLTFKREDKGLPIGVHRTRSNRYNVLHGGNNVYLGNFSCPFEAHKVWQLQRAKLLEEFIDYPNLGIKAKIGLGYQIDSILTDIARGRQTIRSRV